MDQNTNWYIRLKEVVSSPLKKITEMAGGAQKKMLSVANAGSNIAKNSNFAAREIRKTTGSLTDLTNNLRKLETLQSKAFDPKHVQNYEKAINKVKADIANWHKMKTPEAEAPKSSWWQKLKGGFSSQGKKPAWMDELKDQLGNQMSVGGYNPFEMLASPKMLGIAGIVLASAAMSKGVGIAKDFDYGIAKINATAQLGEKTLGKLETRLVEIGSQSGGNFDNITAAYEKILSTTGRVNLSLDITETAIKGANAGFASLDIVGGALAQTLASVGNKNATANEVLDTLLKAKAVGASEFTDFTTYLPGLIASAKNLGIAYKDTAGLFAYMTLKGQSASDSAMLMQNAFSALQKKDVIVGLKAKGIDLFNLNGSRKNIETVFLEITKKLSTLTDKQKTKFLLDIGLNDAQARQAFSVLTDDAKEFKRVMGEVNNSLGETDRQLAMTVNYTRDWGNVMDDLKSIGKGLGDTLLPVIDTLIQGIKGFGKGLRDEVFGLAIFDKSSWRDDEAIKQNALQQNARKIATNRTMEHYKLQPGANFTREQNVFFKSIYDQNLNSVSKLNNKNRIDTKEKEVEKNKPIKLLSGLDNTNIDDSKKKADTGNGGLKTLIQNLYITNHVKTEESADKLKRKMTDDIVDAGRDALVTLGV